MTDLVTHSIALIRANQAPSGAYVACPTFPTYQYCWFRDGAYIAYAMDVVGAHDSAARFYHWATTMIVQRAAQIERAIAAAPSGKPAVQDLLDTRYTLDGAPGDDTTWTNFQLDGFGTLLWGLAQHLELCHQPPPDGWRPAVDLLARYLAALWQEPCYDCWEEFAGHIHTSTLAALYGGLQVATRLLGDPQPERVAARIKDFVLRNCIHNGALVKFVGSTAVDANLLHVATPYRLLSPDDPRMYVTVERIEAELRHNGGGLHRYADDSYYGGGEWVLLTAYLGWYYLDRGEPERAQPLLKWIERQADAAGLLPEQVADNLNHSTMLDEWEQRWGRSACPLLWSHAAYLTLVTRLRATEVRA